MSKNRYPKLVSAAAEFALIVVGVLVALLAESWWSEREDREAERQILVDAVAEFQENLAILDADIAKNTTVIDALLEIENTSDSSLLALTDDEASELFAIEKQIDAAFDPAMGSIDALVRSGDLRLIGDRPLRLHLARWSALLTRAERMESQHTQLMQGSVLRSVPAFEADGVWTVEERRELRELALISKLTLQMSLETMKELRTTAGAVHGRLLELTE